MPFMESEICSTPSRNWADMLSDVLYCVLDKLTLLSDYIRFGAVCRPWFLVTLVQKQQRKESTQKEPPLLLIPVADNPEERGLYSVCEGKIYNYRFSIPYLKRCCGSSYGWWAIAEKDSAEKELAITLFNPFLGSTIHLPSIIKDLERYKKPDDPNYKVEPEFLIHKVILSCDPSLYPDDYIVAAIYDRDSKLALIRSDEEFWNVGHKNFVPVKDMLFHKGLLYAVNGRSHLAAADYVYSNSDSDSASSGDSVFLSEDEEKEIPPDGEGDDNQKDEEIPPSGVDEEESEEIPPAEEQGEDEEEEEEENIVVNHENKPYDGPPMWYIVSEFYREHKDWSYKSYLVESSKGDVLLIRRIFFWDGVSTIDPKDTIDFKVYKLKLNEMHPDNGDGEWIEIQSLENDDALFLGPNHSICLSASHFPNYKANSIYYTDDYPMMSQFDPPHEAKDLGVFHLENRSHGNHFTLNPSLSYMAPVAWISPVLR